MKIFYLKEHTTCRNYVTTVREGFTLYKMGKGDELHHEAQLHHIIFVLEGSIEFRYEHFSDKLSAGQMGFCCKGNQYGMTCMEDAKLLIASFDELSATPCEQSHFTELHRMFPSLEYRSHSLEINQRMQSFIDSLLSYFNDGANCVHFHELKIKEMLWLFRFYYKKKDLASFFYTITGNDQEFKTKVINIYKNTRRVQAMAEAMDMSVAAFKRKFQEEFGESTGKWVQQQFLEEIRIRVADKRCPLKVIADDLNFPSLAEFSKYCKRHLGCTPTQLREGMN